MYILFDESKCLKSINYFLFFNTKKQNIISTIYLIKYYIIKNLNTKVLDSIRSYNSNYKYIISGNFEEIVNIALEQYDFNVYGSSLSIDNNIYTGFTTFICLGKNKQIILDKIISHQEEIGKTKKQINLIVYGDSINDYYLLKKANIRYVVGSNSELINVLNKKKLRFNQII
jgi:phosphoserine phosphatase